MPAGSRARHASAQLRGDGLVVAVVAEHALVGGSVGVALRDFGIDVVLMDLLAPPGALRAECARGLLITELGSDRTIVAARGLLATVPLPWTVVTGASRGPLWGAVLDAGALAVVPSTTSLEEIGERLRDDVPRNEPQDPERRALVDSWEELWRERSDKVTRLTTLTRREMQVLRMLYHGEQVNQIAARRGVTQATVRSQVKSMLRKLGVNSQLAAVAVYSYARAEARPAGGGPRPPASGSTAVPRMRETHPSAAGELRGTRNLLTGDDPRSRDYVDRERWATRLGGTRDDTGW
jgi:two-component system, NarL family, nitrate/nitrite response regulator NarL